MFKPLTLCGVVLSHVQHKAGDGLSQTRSNIANLAIDYFTYSIYFHQIYKM